MTPYILTLLAASLVAAVIELLAPRGEGGRLGSHIRAIAGLYLLVALLSPLRDGLALLSELASGDSLGDHIDAYLSIPEPTERESTLHATVTALCAAEAEAWIRETLDAQFAIPAADCRISLACTVSDTGDAITPTELRISLGGSSALSDPHPIEEYFTAALSCPCYVTVALSS